MKFDHIICPVDFSDAAVNAFRFACEIARIKNSHVHLVHAYDRPYYSVASNSGGVTFAVDGEANSEIRDHIAEEFHKLCENDFAKDLHIERQFIVDVPAWKFYEKLDSRHADVIVMGTRGNTGILHGGVLFGTNTERTIRHSPIPVISVPMGYSARKSNKILFATDFHDSLDLVFGQVVDTANILGAEIVVGMINTRENFASTQFAQEKFTELAGKNPGVKMTLAVHNHYTIEEGVWELCQIQRADMIAMITHGRTGFSHLLRGSIAEDISGNQHVTVPILTLRHTKD